MILIDVPHPFSDTAMWQEFLKEMETMKVSYPEEAEIDKCIERARRVLRERGAD